MDGIAAVTRWLARGARACLSPVLALACALPLATLAGADDGGLFDEPALDFVLYGRANALDRAYRFPEYHSLDVLTQRNDNNRSGASHWPGINQHSMRTFRRLGELSVGNDAVVTAQPLYIHSALVRNVRQPVLIVATSKNEVLAFPPVAGAAPLWRVSLGLPLKSVEQGVTNPGAKCWIAPNAAWAQKGASGFVGIEATPVIDVVNNQVLVGYKTPNGDHGLAAIDLNCSPPESEPARCRPRVSVPVSPSDAAANSESSKLHRNRASLLLADGVVYLAFSSLCEGSPDRMHGSLVAFDARTLAHVGTFPVTDDATDGGGVWQGANGPAADTAGNVYFVTGNRRLPPPCLVGVGTLGRRMPRACRTASCALRRKSAPRATTLRAPTNRIGCA